MLGKRATSQGSNRGFVKTLKTTDSPFLYGSGGPGVRSEERNHRPFLGPAEPPEFVGQGTRRAGRQRLRDRSSASHPGFRPDPQAGQRIAGVGFQQCFVIWTSSALRCWALKAGFYILAGAILTWRGVFHGNLC